MHSNKYKHAYDWLMVFALKYGPNVKKTNYFTQYNNSSRALCLALTNNLLFHIFVRI